MGYFPTDQVVAQIRKTGASTIIKPIFGFYLIYEEVCAMTDY
jgi:hypothetical protein